MALAALAAVSCLAADEERPPATAMPTVAAASVPAEAAAPDAGNALEELSKACRSLAAVKSFRALMTTTGEGADKIETRTEAALPDRFHVVNADYELIIIGSDVHKKMPGGRWEKSLTGLAVTSLTDPKKLEQYLQSAKVTLIGDDTLDGSPVRVYRAAAAHSPARKSVHDDPEPFDMKIWVGSSDGLPRRLEGTVLSTRNKTAVVYYDYNAKIAVKKPTG